MPTIRIYEHGKNARLFDGHLVVTLAMMGYKFNPGFSKNGTTRTLGRMGYERTSPWKKADWGWEAKFKRKEA